MYLIALKMLYGDRTKFIALVVGLTFATLLITQQVSVLCGMTLRFTALIRATQAPIWVMSKSTSHIDGPKPLLDNDLMRVRSIEGVKWAQPLVLATLQARLDSGMQQGIKLVGIDGASLYGAPQRVYAGDIRNLTLPDAVAIDINDQKLLGNPKIGETLEINDKRAVVVAIVKIPANVMSTPVVYTTYDKALNYIPPQRKLLSFILVKARDNIPEKELIKRIKQQPELMALSEREFSMKTIRWYVNNTGMPINFAITVFLGILVGAAISAQTFYTFVIENIKEFATLKAIGFSNSTLIKMTVLQSLVVGLIGYSIGIGILPIIGSTIPKFTKLAFYTPYPVLLLGLVIIVGISMLSSLISITRILKIEPAIVFRY